MASTPTPLPGEMPPPVVEILTGGPDHQGQISLAPGATLDLSIAASGRDLIYQWDLQGQGLLEKVVGYRGAEGQTNRYAAPVPAAGEVVQDTVTVTVTDLDNRSATDRLTIVVDGRSEADKLATASPTRVAEQIDQKPYATPTVSLTPVTTPPIPTATATPITCVFTIVQPPPHSTISEKFPVWGTATSGCRGSDTYWLTLSTENRQWPQRAPLILFPNSQSDDLGWFANAEINESLRQEKVLGIFVVATPPELDTRFKEWVSQLSGEALADGFSTVELLQEDATIVTGISVLGG